jgi:hypothetical protein
MLSTAEMNDVYGGTPASGGRQGVHPSGSLVDMPSDDATTELNPQSLSFDEISVGHQPETPATKGARNDSTSTPFMAEDGARSSARPLAAAALGGAIGSGDPAEASMWHLAYYKPLFDVDSHHILTRTIHALLPRPRAQFFEVVASNPDLYGPFWVSTTLIFLIGVSGNLAKWLSFRASAEHPTWTYDFTKLSGASTVVYFYAAAAPVGVWAALRYIEANKRLVDVVCLYGYSLATFVPVSLLCTLPSTLLRWLLLSLGCAASAAFLLSNVYTHLQDCFPYSDSDSMRRGYMLLAAMGGAHVAFALALKICFF